MADATYDTLAAAQRLGAAGIEREHAEAIAETVRDGRAGLATKTDLDKLATRIEATLYRALWIQTGTIIAAIVGLAVVAALALDLFARFAP